MPRYSPYVAETFDGLTFGFEFEFVGNNDDASVLRFRSYMESRLGLQFVHTGVYGKNAPDVWTLGADGSVRDISGRGRFGFELVSPILRQKDFPLIHDVLRGVRDVLDGDVNDTCGTHVHIGSLTTFDRHNAQGNREFSSSNAAVWLFSKTQPYLWNRLVHETRANNKYCHAYVDGGFETEKYLALSASGFSTFKHPTMECRLHHGTLDAEAITRWAYVVAKFLWHCVRVKPSLHINPEWSESECMRNLMSQFGVPEDIIDKCMTAAYVSVS